MAEMICPACHSKMDSDMSECPVCGMFNPRITGSVENKQEILNQLAQRHIEDTLKKIEISVMARSHKVEDDKYVLKDIQCVKLMEGKDLVFGEKVWSDHPFARSRQAKDSTVDMVVRAGEQKKEITLVYETPDLKDLWYVGFELREGFRVAVFVGNESVYAEAGVLQLI